MGLATQMMKEVADLIRLGFPESTATKIASGELPMDTASRMQRAEEQGYDVDTPVYHGTDADFDEFDPERAVGSQFWSTTNKAAVESGEVGAAGHGVIKELLHRINNPADWDDYDNLLLDEIIGRGYDGLKLPDPDGNSVMVAFEPEQYKSVDAAFDPDYKGSNLLGEYALPAGSTALMASLLAAPEEAEAGFVTRGGRELLEAWHGSPHQFDKFSMDHLGTGEGAQAYGHGLYMADEVDTAKTYRPRDHDNESWQYDRYKEAEESGDQYMMDAWERAMMHDTPAELRASALDPDYDEYSQAAFAQVADELEANPGGGGLYRTEIDVKPDQLLDWDASYKDQPKAIKDAFDRLMDDKPADGIVKNTDGSIDPDASGMLMYSILSDSARMGDLQKNQAAASNMLSESGIKGIRYKDGQSRGSEGGSSNYVVFDDKLINIAERGAATPGMMALLGAGGAGATAAGSESNAVTEATSRIVNHMLDNVTEVTDLLEIPQRGIQGLLRAGYGLMQGDGLDASLNAGADVVNQGVEATAKQAGDAMLEKTGNPELATMAYTAVMLGSPL